MIHSDKGSPENIHSKVDESNDTFSWMISVSFDHLERRHSVLS